MKVIIGLFIGMMLMAGTANAALFMGGFGFGSDYNLTAGNTSLFTSSGIELTNGTAFVGNNATGSFASMFGNATFDVASNDSIPLTVGTFNISNFLYDFIGVDTSAFPVITGTNLNLAIDLFDVTSLVTDVATGLLLQGNVIIRDTTGFYDNTNAFLTIELSEAVGQNGDLIHSAAGNIIVASVPEPSTIFMILLGIGMIYRLNKKNRFSGTNTNGMMQAVA